MTTLMDSISVFVASSGVLIATRATLVLLLTLGAISMARRRRASVRHLLLAAAFAVLLALPFATVARSAFHIQSWSVMPVIGEFVNGPVADSRAPSQRGPSFAQQAMQRLADGIGNQRNLVSAVWVGGMLAFALPLLVGLGEARRLRLTGRSWSAGQTLVDSLAREAGLRRPVHVVLHDRVTTPATWGVRHHTILFPIDAITWSNEDVRRAAIHEIEHARRGDCLINLVVRVVCAIYWFHPLVWVALQRLCLEAERASDDAVLRDGDATAYAEQLVTLAGRLPVNDGRSPLMAIVNRHDLLHRVTAILDEQQSRGQVSKTLAFAIGLVTFGVIVAMSPIQNRVEAVSEDRLVGLWDIHSAAPGNQIVLRLCYAELFSRSELSPEQVTWWQAGMTGPIRFAFSRDAGSFTFEGTVANSTATGSFTFEPSAQFASELQRRGQSSLTPSQYLALAQHDIGLAAFDAQAGTNPLRIIAVAQAQAHLEDLAARVRATDTAFPRMC